MLELVKSPNPILQKKLPDFDFANPIMDPFDLEEQMVLLMQAGIVRVETENDLPVYKINKVKLDGE